MKKPKPAASAPAPKRTATRGRVVGGSATPGGAGRKAYSLGAWIDETMPNLADLLTPHGIEPKTFAAWLGPQLGEYRFGVKIDEQAPSMGDERRIVLAQLAAVKAAVSALAPGAMPPRAGAIFGAVAFHAEVNSLELLKGLRKDLQLLHMLLHQVGLRLEVAPSKRGRKSLAQRDALLASIVDFLRACGLRGEALSETAEQILRRCGVQSPGGLEAVEKATRRGKGKK